MDKQVAPSIQLKILVWNFRNSTCPMEQYIPVAQTQSNPSCRTLGYCSCKQTTILSNGRGHFYLTDWNDRTSQSGPFSKVFPNIPVRPNQNGLFHLISNWNFWNFGLNARLCSSRARWPLGPNFCPRATRKSQIFHTNHMLGTLDFTVSEHWAPFNFP